LGAARGGSRPEPAGLSEARYAAPLRVLQPGDLGDVQDLGDAGDGAATGPATSSPMSGVVDLPLGPLASRPDGVSRPDALLMVAAAMDGLPVDSGDRTLLAWAETRWQTPDLVIFASLIARARQEGAPVAPLVQRADGPATGWGVVCVPCGAVLLDGPIGQGVAEATARAHDRDVHDGGWVADLVPVDAEGRPATPLTSVGGGR
jgi:hypothetical protein